MKKTNQGRDLSIILTCCNERRLLEAGFERLLKLFALTNLNYEIVIVDDFSTDGSREYIKQLESGYEHVCAIMHETNKGRGAAVTTGIRAARGRVVGFADLDFSTDPVYIIKLYEQIIEGADIATASRIYKLNWRSINVLHRYILHKGYKMLVKMIFRTPLIDTETGCKFFNKDSVMSYIDEIEDMKWFWDTEVMIRGHFHHMKIAEIPTLFIRQPETGSTVRVIRDTRRYLMSLIKFYSEFRRLKREK